MGLGGKKGQEEEGSGCRGCELYTRPISSNVNDSSLENSPPRSWNMFQVRGLCRGAHTTSALTVEAQS